MSLLRTFCPGLSSIPKHLEGHTGCTKFQVSNQESSINFNIFKETKYFKVFNDLNNVKFARSMKPKNVNGEVDPVLITFSDGNPDAFGTVAYALWTLLDGTKAVRLIMSKAKISPL